MKIFIFKKKSIFDFVVYCDRIDESVFDVGAALDVRTSFNASVGDDDIK